MGPPPLLIQADIASIRWTGGRGRASEKILAPGLSKPQPTGGKIRRVSPGARLKGKRGMLKISGLRGPIASGRNSAVGKMGEEVN